MKMQEKFQSASKSRCQIHFIREELIMKANLTELVFIIDKSGSMSGLESDTIGGFNSMLAKQKNETGEAFLSTVLFDTRETVLYDRARIDQVPCMTKEDYVPGGCTALLDALGGAIHHIATIHKYAREEDRPGKTMFVIITDGYENSSRRYSVEEVRSMIEKEQKEYGWEFLFLGANIDAVAEASRYGIQAERAVNYCPDARGTQLNYSSVSDAISSVRNSRPMGASWKSAIEKDYRKRGEKKRGRFGR